VKREVFEWFLTAQFKNRLALMRRKGHDYSDEDILANFKRMARVARTLKIDPTQPHGIAFIYEILKKDRLCKLLNKKIKPKNESLRDTLIDLKNYIDLLEACLREEGLIQGVSDD